MRIAQVAPPLERVPPRAYGGTERIVSELVVELHRRGYDVTTFASGDSVVPGGHVVTVPEATRPAGFGGDTSPLFYQTMAAVLDRAHEFDLIHSHLEFASVILTRTCPVPVVSTFHGRLDAPWAGPMLAGQPGLVAISRNQASAHPSVDWAGIVHNGLSLAGAPFERRRGEALAFVGRVAPEKGIVEAIEIARRAGRPLRIIAKVGTQPLEVQYHESVFLPALEAAGSLVEFVGELAGDERDRIVSQSYALLMPGTWPEPFGLAAIEALACGTPVLTRRVGALPEIIRDGVDGFFGDDAAHLAFLMDRIEELDREAIRTSAIERFSAKRMTDDYEAVYRRVLAGIGRAAGVEEVEGLLEGVASGSAAAGDRPAVVPLAAAGRRAARTERETSSRR